MKTAALDIDYLMKSSLAISAEIEQAVLLKKIMDVVIESSGARDGYLVIEKEGDLFVRAESHIEQKQPVRISNQKIGAAANICKAIARYVYRTGERLILDNASREGIFKDNPEARDMQLRSVFCLPLVKQSKIIGILYLENRLSESVFTAEKILMTELLALQAAVAFENSQLVERMKKTQADEETYRLTLEDTYRATLNILEDFNEEKSRLRLVQQATMNLLEDMNDERDKLDHTRSALTNILEDVETERVETEQAKMLLESVNKELEAFSYSVSHDLRAPLRAISGFSQAVIEDYALKLEAEGNRYLRLIQENAGKMGRLIDDLLTFSRLGRQDLTKSDIDMEVLARTIAGELKGQVPQREIIFAIKPVPRAHGDKTTIQQVLVNLLSNAVKFTRGGQKTLIEFGYLPELAGGAYYVKDNGVGFDMRYADKLFGVFQRLHSAAEFEGTGIGLALVSRIISRHEGKVWAEGRLGEGAIFYFSLPPGE